MGKHNQKPQKEKTHMKEKGCIQIFQGMKMDTYGQSYHKMKIGMTPQGMPTRCKKVETTLLPDK